MMYFPLVTVKVGAMADNKREPGQSELEQLYQSLGDGEPVDKVVGGTGYIHFDRPRPYLCLHRRLPDEKEPGTDQLLAGLGAYTLLPAWEGKSGWQIEFLQEIAAIMIEKFGVFLLFEVWSRQGHAPMENTEKEIRFSVCASETGVEFTTLHALETAILEQDWQGYKPRLEVSYDEGPNPLQEKTGNPSNGMDQKQPLYLGLEIDAIYQDPATHALRPDVLRAVSADFSRCLKVALFAFSIRKSTRKPAHFHQLGSHLITDRTMQADAILTRVGAAFDLVLYATPVNTSQAWDTFRRSEFRVAPEFHYRPLTVNVSALKHELYNAPVDEIEDPALHFIFDERRMELDRQLSMLKDQGTVNFLLGSQQIYAPPDAQLLGTANTLLNQFGPVVAEKDGALFCSSQELASHASEMMHSMDIDNPSQAQVEIRDDLPGIMVSGGRLLIGRQARFSKSRIPAILNHEIGTHVLTYHNGGAQPFLHLQVGLAGYQGLQEGLAVLAEYLSGGLNAARARHIAGRAVAVDAVVRGAGFIETFHFLAEEHGFDARLAFSMSMRVHRSGGFTKDVVYLRGLLEVQALLQDGHDLNDLLIGKFASTHVDIIEELRWRNILRPCKFPPPYLADENAKSRLAVVAQGKSVFDDIGDW